MKLSVKALRVNAGVKVKDAAKHLGISHRAYIRKENGETRFYVDEAVRLAHLFGVPEEIFFEAACRQKTHSA